MTLGKLLTVSPSSSLCMIGMTIPALRRKEKVCERALNKMQGRDGHPYPSVLSLSNGWNTVGLGREHKSNKLTACGSVGGSLRLVASSVKWGQ